MQNLISQNTEQSYNDLQNEKCNMWNKIPGNIGGYNCELCLNRGGNYIIRNGEMIFKQCKCVEIRASIKRIDSSGLSGMLGEFTFDSFNDSELWQKSLKQSAQTFISDCNGKWFFVGGQIGAGKTHICTAIVGKFLKAGKSARYMLWRDEVAIIKANVNDDVQYSKLMIPLKSVDVLYIDDFLWTSKDENGNAKSPTKGDLNVAFELINHRYCNKSLITIISCEHYVDTLTDIDEAVGSRIYQRTKGYCNIIRKDKSRNYRMK